MLVYQRLGRGLFEQQKTSGIMWTCTIMYTQSAAGCRAHAACVRNWHGNCQRTYELGHLHRGYGTGGWFKCVDVFHLTWAIGRPLVLTITPGRHWWMFGYHVTMQFGYFAPTMTNSFGSLIISVTQEWFGPGSNGWHQSGCCSSTLASVNGAPFRWLND